MKQIPNIEEMFRRTCPVHYNRPLPETCDKCCLAKDWKQTHHHQLQKAREERKGWKGYVVVDPETDNYTYSNVYFNRTDAENWLKANSISGLKIIEVDVYHSELDQDNKYKIN